MDRKGADPALENFEEQDRQGNVKQNTTNQGHQRDHDPGGQGLRPDRSAGRPREQPPGPRPGPSPRPDRAPRPGPRQRRTPDRSRVSGGGGERDKHHAHVRRTRS